LALVQLVSRLRGSQVIIDWHNLGYTILAMRLGEKSRLVALAKRYVFKLCTGFSLTSVHNRFEQYFGRSAYAHLFVTNAMKDYLVTNWDLQYVNSGIRERLVDSLVSGVIKWSFMIDLRHISINAHL
jgi:beta-1,4-mannosyltransferase